MVLGERERERESWTSSASVVSQRRSYGHCLCDCSAKHKRVHLYSRQSPGEIKRREVSWTLKKKLAQKRSRAGRWCWARERERERERELDFFCFSCFPTAELQTLPLWLFCIAVVTAIALCGGRCAMADEHCLNIPLFWRRSTAALVFWVGACFEVSLFCPPFTTHPRP